MTCSRQFFTEISEFYPQRENNAHTVYNTCPQITTVYFHALQRAREEITFTTWPNIWSCTPKLLATAKAYFVCHISSLFQISLISPCFDLCLHWVSVVRDYFGQHALWQDNCAKYRRIDSCWRHFSSSLLYQQKAKPTYPNPKYLFGIGIWIWAAKNLAIVCPLVPGMYTKEITLLLQN